MNKTTEHDGCEAVISDGHNRCERRNELRLGLRSKKTRRPHCLNNAGGELLSIRYFFVT